MSALCWSSAAILYGYAVKNRDPLMVTILRIHPAFLVTLIGVLLLRELKLEILFDPWILLLAIITGAIGMFLGSYTYMYSLKKAGVSVVYPIAFSYPIYVSLITIAFLGERFSVGIPIGLALLITGLYLISSEKSTSREKDYRKGVIVAVITSLIWALNAILAKIALYRAPPVLFAMMRLLTLSILVTPLLLQRIYEAREFSRSELLAATIGGAIGIGIGLIFSHLAIVDIGAARTTIIGSSSPALSILLATIFLKEKPGKRALIGALIVSAAIFVVAIF